MDDVKKILVVCRIPEYCRKAVRYGVSLSKRYGAELYVVHVIYDPFILGDWNLPIPSIEEVYKKVLANAKKELDKVIAFEKEKGMVVKELIREGDPAKEILKTVTDEKIDLLIISTHGEGKLEHLLFGRSNDELLRKMPCSILTVKEEPEPIQY